MPQKSRTQLRKLPQQERSKMTVDAILTATAHILIEDGYDKASTNRIAELAGVSIGSLYQYFPNKEALIASLAERHAMEMIDMVETKLRDLFDAPLKTVIQEIVRGCIAAHAVNPSLHRVLTEQVPSVENLKQVKNAEEQIKALLRNYLEKHDHQHKLQNLDLTIFILGRTVESLTHAAVIDHPEFLNDRQLEQQITDLLLSYLEKNMNAGLS